MAITKTDHGNGISTWVWDTDGTTQIRCNDCGQWVHASGSARIRHSKRCDTPTAQPIRTPTPAAPMDSTIAQPLSANGLSNEEALHAVQRGYLTSDQAMNRDF